MKVTGFASHVAHNRQRALASIALYCLAFIPIGLLALGVVPILVGQSEYSLLRNPLLYAAIFLPVVVALSLGILALNYFRMRQEIEESLNIQGVTEQQEPRLARIGGEQATLQGLRHPSFGVIESPARNAISLGVTPGQRMIAVTRGLLNDLDDEEVAAVIAHELAHFRLGDARLLSLNQAMMRTATALQVYNPLKVELNMHTKMQWHFVIAMILPIFLVAQAVGGLVTMAAWRAARHANGAVRGARDFIADAEALRITHFPEALLTATAKCEGNGYFPGAEKFEAMLFSGNPESQGGTHPQPEKRKAEIQRVAAKMAMPGRQRRDTRAAGVRPALTPSGGGFGRKGGGMPAFAPALAVAGGGSFQQASARTQELPREPGAWLLYAWIFDRKTYRAWQRGMFDQMAWRADDKRNMLGATPLATVWLVGALIVSSAFFYAVADSPADMIDRMSGRAYLEASDEVAGSLFCAPSDTQCQAARTFEHTSDHPVSSPN